MRILIGVLHWGLGHATRTAALADRLLAEGHEVVLASDGAAAEWLRRRFPEIPVEELPSYNITYPAGGSWLLHFLLNAGDLRRVYRREKLAARRLADLHRPDRIISDNRPGFRDDRCYNIYLTSQLRVYAGWASWLVSRVHRLVMTAFQEIWVPDFADPPGLGGKLSHASCPRPLRYLGPLSHLRVSSAGNRYSFGMILSGPEPHRTMLARQLLQQAGACGLKCFMILGSTETDFADPPENIEIHPLAESGKVEELLSRTSHVVARCGYSTLMDLDGLPHHALLIPTPGQAEQEYLGRLHRGHSRWTITSQKNLDLGKWLEKEGLTRLLERKTEG